MQTVSVSASRACLLLGGISRQHLRHLLRCGRLQGIGSGPSRKITTESIAHYLEKKRARADYKTHIPENAAESHALSLDTGLSLSSDLAQAEIVLRNFPERALGGLGVSAELRLLTIPMAAALLGVDEAVLRREIYRGSVHSTQVGARRRVTVADLRDWIRRGGTIAG